MKIITLCSVKADGKLFPPGYEADIDDDVAEELIALGAVAPYAEVEAAAGESDEVPAKRPAGGKKTAAAGESE